MNGEVVQSRPRDLALNGVEERLDLVDDPGGVFARKVVPSFKRCLFGKR